MKKTKNKIYQQDWLKLHPYKTSTSSDSYFVSLSNILLEIIDDVFKKEISDKAKRTIALSVAAYFEDIISGFGLWQGFTRKHFDMYGKYLPFYELTDSYIPEEINPEDVLFLIWSIMQMELRETREIMFNPENIGLMSLGVALFAALDKEYETAPENEMLQDFFTKAANYDDFFNFRSAVSWFYYDSYLIAPYTEGHLEKALDGLNKHKKYGDMIAYSITNELIFKNPCGPLALKTHEWFGAIVGEDTDLGKMLLQTRFKYKMPKSYLLTDKNELGLTLLPFDSDESVFLSNGTFQQDAAYEHKDAVLCNLIYFNGKWELNGFMMNIPKEEYDKNREEEEKMRNNAEYSMKLFLKANKNKPICYFKDEKEIKNFFNKAYKLQEEIRGDMFEERENLVTFANPEFGVTTISDIALYIKDKDNPYYNKEEAENTGLALIGEIELFRELIEYILENNLVPDLGMNSLRGKDHGRKLVQDNLDFLFRFFQPFSYR